MSVKILQKQTTIVTKSHEFLFLQEPNPHGILFF